MLYYCYSSLSVDVFPRFHCSILPNVLATQLLGTRTLYFFCDTCQANRRTPQDEYHPRRSCPLNQRYSSEEGHVVMLLYFVTHQWKSFYVSSHFLKVPPKTTQKIPCTLKVCHHQAQWWNTMAPGSTTNGEKSSVVMALSSSFRMEWFLEMKKNFRRFAWDNQVWIHFRSFKFCRLLRKRKFREGTFTFLFPRPDID